MPFIMRKIISFGVLLLMPIVIILILSNHGHTDIDGICINETGNGVSIQNNTHEYVIVHVEKGDIYYNCYIEQDGYKHNILLTKGTGKYTIDIYSKDKGDIALEYSIDKELSQDITYTGSSYNVEIEKYDNYIEDIIKQNNWDKDTELKAIWNYMYKYNYRYDVEDKINSGEIKVYIPDLGETMESKSGICYDIASLTTAICRKVYGEAKLCVGYVNNDYDEYHAWCEVKQGDKWINLDTIRRDSYDYEDDRIKYEIVDEY